MVWPEQVPRATSPYLLAEGSVASQVGIVRSTAVAYSPSFTVPIVGGVNVSFHGVCVTCHLAVAAATLHCRSLRCLSRFVTGDQSTVLCSWQYSHETVMVAAAFANLTVVECTVPPALSQGDYVPLPSVTVWVVPANAVVFSPFVYVWWCHGGRVVGFVAFLTSGCLSLQPTPPCDCGAHRRLRCHVEKRHACARQLQWLWLPPTEQPQQCINGVFAWLCASARAALAWLCCDVLRCTCVRFVWQMYPMDMVAAFWDLQLVDPVAMVAAESGTIIYHTVDTDGVHLAIAGAGFGDTPALKCRFYSLHSVTIFTLPAAVTSSGAATCALPTVDSTNPALTFEFVLLQHGLSVVDYRPYPRLQEIVYVPQYGSVSAATGEWAAAAFTTEERLVTVNGRSFAASQRTRSVAAVPRGVAVNLCPAALAPGTLASSRFRGTPASIMRPLHPVACSI